MKKLKFFVVCLMTAALTLSVLSGCKKTAQDASTDSIIRIDWMPQNDSPVDADSPIVKMYEEKFGVDLNFIYIDRSKETELLNIRIASGEIPDVMRKKDPIYRNFIAQKVISEIPEELIKKVAPTLYENTLKYSEENLWNAAKQDGKLYGMPVLNNSGRYHAVSIWRDDWLRNVGINKIPETISEAEEAFVKFVNNDPDRNGIKDTFAFSTNGINAILNAYGGEPLKDFWMMRDGKVMHSAVFPEMKDALALLNKWYNQGLIDPEFITGENKGQHFANTPVFWNGRIGYSLPGMAYHVSPPFVEGSLGSSNYNNFHQIQGDDASFTYGVPLIGPNGARGAEQWGVFSGDMVMLGRNVETNSEKMKKILEICEAINSDFDFYILCKFGRKGIDYSDDGTYISNLEPKQAHTLGLAQNGILYLGNNLEFVKRSELAAEREFAEKHGNVVKGYTNLIWGGLPSDAMYKSIVSSKVKENYYAFITGARPISEFDAFVDELNKAGLEQLTKEANEWYKERYGN